MSKSLKPVIWILFYLSVESSNCPSPQILLLSSLCLNISFSLSYLLVVSFYHSLYIPLIEPLSLYLFSCLPLFNLFLCFLFFLCAFPTQYWSAWLPSSSPHRRYLIFILSFSIPSPSLRLLRFGFLLFCHSACSLKVSTWDAKNADGLIFLSYTASAKSNDVFSSPLKMPSIPNDKSCSSKSETESCVFIQLCICLHYEEDVNTALHSLHVESSLWLVFSDLVFTVCISENVCSGLPLIKDFVSSSGELKRWALCDTLLYVCQHF